MPGKIKLLDSSLINKIAAGEIVERPASIIKELVENSIDADSTQIKIFVEHGGIRSICVIDNGFGMSKDDAVMAFERHTTSKISTSEDLNNINTMGFRGEALASIASISYVEMETKTEKDIAGSKIEVEGDILRNMSDVGCHEGTKIIVSHIFYNVPARKKFLKTVNTELMHIINTATQYMIAFPEIAFTLAHNNHILYDFPKTKNIEERIYAIYGDELKGNLLKAEYKVDNKDLYISGYISRPSYSKPNKNYQLVFVNKRGIKSKIVSHAIYEGYHTLLMVDRHPMAIIYLNLPPHQVDVNVHPAKKEVKFVEDKFIHDSVCHAISCTLKNNNYERKAYKEEIINEGSNKDSSLISVGENTQAYASSRAVEKHNLCEYASLFNNEGLADLNTDKDNNILKPLAQIMNSYWIVEDENDTYIIDQHAFHERIMYEKIISSLKNNHFEIQRLLFPINIEVSQEEAAFIKDNLKQFNNFGLDIEYFGGTTFVIKEVPVFLTSSDIKEVLLNIFSEFSMNKTRFNFIEKMAVIMACHSAVRAGDRMSIEEIKSILNEARTIGIHFYCPHGRPAIIKITVEELEKKFKRTS
ncbi:MAG: DNA mismatch repair endonuclease MutL [Candidatus Firestonebacteria bacterium]|nr:DNA mismatch repair endonuclease MutL [Candidatus Firestonebacteria bacterium]